LDGGGDDSRGERREEEEGKGRLATKTTSKAGGMVAS
jgi:hypothetical protein